MNFIFSGVYRSVNYIGSRIKRMNPEGVHVGVHVNYVGNTSINIKKISSLPIFTFVSIKFLTVNLTLTLKLKQ